MRLTDTNVLLYAVSPLPEEAHKRRRARDLLRQSDLALSVQVFQEFYYQATRRTRLGRLTHDDALAFLGTLLKFPVQDAHLMCSVTPLQSVAAISCPIGTARFLRQLVPWDAMQSILKT